MVFVSGRRTTQQRDFPEHMTQLLFDYPTDYPRLLPFERRQKTIGRSPLNGRSGASHKSPRLTFIFILFGRDGSPPRRRYRDLQPFDMSIAYRLTLVDLSLDLYRLIKLDLLASLTNTLGTGDSEHNFAQAVEKQCVSDGPETQQTRHISAATNSALTEPPIG